MNKAFLLSLVLSISISNNVFSQGFELFLGEEPGDNYFLLLTEIPNSENYLSVWRSGNNLKFSEKLSNRGFSSAKFTDGNTLLSFDC